MAGAVRTVLAYIKANAHFATWFSAASTPVADLANLFVFPPLIFATYVVCCGRRRAHAEIALVCALALWVPAGVQIGRSLRPSLPGGYFDMVLVVDAMVILCLQCSLTLGVVLRRRMLSANAPGRTRAK